jgi:hypothetical protein
MSDQRSKSREKPSRSVRPESASEEIEDRLAGLLPEDALQVALAGLAPEEITGPGGLMTQLAGRGGQQPQRFDPGAVHTELGTVESRSWSASARRGSRAWTSACWASVAAGCRSAISPGI